MPSIFCQTPRKFARSVNSWRLRGQIGETLRQVFLWVDRAFDYGGDAVENKAYNAGALYVRGKTYMKSQKAALHLVAK